MIIFSTVDDNGRNNIMSRQQLFKYALARAGIKISQFARTLDVTPSYIHKALNENGSPAIQEKINFFINKQIPQLKNDLQEFLPLV